MPRQQRGILGMRKDPKNQILFSFNVKEGEEWPSDDEDDLDYRPGKGQNSDSDSPGPSGGAARKKKTEKKKVASKRRKTDDGSNIKKKVAKLPDAASVYNGNVPTLPTEIWEKIFQLVVQDEGAVPFLCRAAKVCPLWKDISAHPNLWQKVDMSSGRLKLKPGRFNELCKQRLSECTTLNLTNSALMAKLTCVQAIANHCTKLRTLNLSLCNKLPTDSVVTIVNACRHLEDLDLSSTTADSVSPKTLNHIIDKCGANLRHLVLSSNQLSSFSVVFTSLIDNCPQLEHLDISNIKFSKGFMALDIERFQRSCPRLRTLGLANSIFRASVAVNGEEEMSPGFPELEELSLASTLKDNSAIFTGVTPEVIHRLLKTSEKLTVLDMRGCKNMDALACLMDIPATHLEQFYLSKSVAHTYDNIPLHTLFKKWRHSLTDIDLSWNTLSKATLDQALDTLCSGTAPCTLRSIDMSGTDINMDMVKNVVSGLPNLKHLDLSSCRDVTRGWKREYKSVADLDKLRDKIGLS